MAGKGSSVLIDVVRSERRERAKPIGRGGVVNSVALIVFIGSSQDLGVLFNESVVGGFVIEGVVGGNPAFRQRGWGKAALIGLLDVEYLDFEGLRS